MSRRAESVEELFPLLEACKAGDLEAVGQWIASGKPLDPPAGKRSRRRSPLEIAIEKGFLTLAKTLLNAGADPAANGNALDFAVGCGRPDLVRLLLDHGVDVHSVSLSTVMWRQNPEIIRLFLDRGADALTNEPLYEGLTSYVRPLLGIFKEYKERFPDWQRQVNRALLYHIKHGGVKNVALLVWAGAQPDTVAAGEHEIQETALEAAACESNLQILKLLKPAQYPALLDEMLRQTWLRTAIPVVDYLLGLGAKLNDQEAGGSELLATVIRHKLDEWPVTAARDAEESFRFIDHICKLGARWIPEGGNVKETRRGLRRVPAENLFRLVTILLEHKAAAPELIEAIFSTPGMRTRMGSYHDRIQALLHPPATMKKRSMPSTATPPSPLLPLQEVRARAREWLLSICIEKGPRPFHSACYTSWVTPKLIRSRLGLSKDDERDPHEILDEVCAGLNRKLTTVDISCGSTRRGRRGMIDVNLAAGAEWRDVLREVSGMLGTPPSHWITAEGERVLALLDEGGIGSEPIEEGELCGKLNLELSADVEGCLKDLQVRTGGEVRFERTDAKGGGPRFRVWRDKAGGARSVPPALNPEWDANFGYLTKADMDGLRNMLRAALLKLRPTGSAAVPIYRLESRSELKRCFPNLSCEQSSSPSFQLVDAFSTVPINSSLKRSYDFRNESPVWHFSLAPLTNWADALNSIEQEMQGPSVEQRYGISPDAARLLDWLQRLATNRLQSGWSPTVEDSNSREIGLSPIGGSDSFPFYLRILTDEINEHTPFVVTAFCWTEYSRQRTRLKLATKPSGLEAVVRQIQWLGLQHGRLLNATEVQNLLRGFIGKSASSP